jgi:hypothetical protein
LPVVATPSGSSIVVNKTSGTLPHLYIYEKQKNHDRLLTVYDYMCLTSSKLHPEDLHITNKILHPINTQNFHIDSKNPNTGSVKSSVGITAIYSLDFIHRCA